jgi:signal transduction histidine kinase
MHDDESTLTIDKSSRNRSCGGERIAEGVVRRHEEHAARREGYNLRLGGQCSGSTLAAHNRNPDGACGRRCAWLSLVPLAYRSRLDRIAQECLTNILKHAGASRVSLVLRKQDGCVQMRVEDNGIGFDTEDITGRDAGDKGLGLATMHERARMLKGSLQIRSRKAGGNTITLTVPLHDRGIQL